MNPLAEKLNDVLLKKAPQIYESLTSEGRKAYFPKEGIVGQSAEAKSTRINATIGQAFEDDGQPMSLDSVVENIALPKEEALLYSPSYGQKELRELWQREIRLKNPSLGENPAMSMPIVTSGLTHGISTIRKLFVSRGDDLVLPDKFWDNYSLIFKNAKMSHFDLFYDGGFNMEGFSYAMEKIKDNRLTVILNFPNNPTGYTPLEDEGREIAERIKHAAKSRSALTVICDDAYFGLTYEPGVMKESIFSKLANLDEKVLAIKIDGATKEMYTWGLRSAFITYASKNLDKEVATVLEDKTAGAVREIVSNAPSISQSILTRAIKSPYTQEQSSEKYKILKERYETVKKTLQENPRYEEFFKALPFNSGYFMCIEFKDKTPEQTNELRKKLIQEHSTGLIALGNTLRVAYSAVSKAVIPELFENVYKACKS